MLQLAVSDHICSYQGGEGVVTHTQISLLLVTMKRLMVTLLCDFDDPETIQEAKKMLTKQDKVNSLGFFFSWKIFKDKERVTLLLEWRYPIDDNQSNQFHFDCESLTHLKLLLRHLL